MGACAAGLACRRARRVRVHPAHRGGVPAGPRDRHDGRAWRQRAVSCWGCLLYSAFCLSTARLTVQAQPKQTAQSEQRQDTGVTAELLRTGWGRAILILAGVLAVAAGVETGRRSVRLDFRERFTAEHMPRALAILIRPLGAVGCVARAVVFVLVGYLALRLALASRGRAGAPASSAGAVQAAGAWGRVPLVVLVAGLGAYALTQLIEAVFRPARAETTIGRWRQRAVSSWGCLLYLAFCLSTARLLAATRPKGTAGSEHRQDTDMTAALLQTGWGRLLLALVGVAAVAAGVEVGRRSVRLDFQERFTAAHMSRALATLTRALGGAGCAARAVVLVLAGFFILKAAVLSEAKQTKGLDVVFRSVASTAYGSWLLALLASGLLCYGLYCLLEARYRDLTPGR